ncbi:MAG: hypothetical protein HY960_10570 [Ignavibacteriae bacterium]|nr:hypothetical protein [Ignavibacteriota bacterium]
MNLCANDQTVCLTVQTIRNWGYAQWAKPLVSLMLDGINGIADYQCKQILSERYHRLAPVFPEGSKYDMDAVDKIDEMIAFAESVDMRGVVEWVGGR